MADDSPTPAEPQVSTADAAPAPEKPVTAKKKPATPEAAKAKAKAKAKAPVESKAKAPAESKAKAPAESKAKAKAPARTRAKRRSRETGSDRAPVVRAQAKYVRTSARKARLVCDHIRGKSVVEARAILAFAPRAVAADWAKLLNSAVANAEHNHELIGEDLRVMEAFADEGPTLKRFRPRAMGRATPIRKRTSHLTITLTPKE